MSKTHYKAESFSAFSANALSVHASCKSLMVLSKEGLGREIDNPWQGPPTIAAGATILNALAIELLLKCLHLADSQNDKFPGGHNLKTLFSELRDLRLKQAIAENFELRTHSKLTEFLTLYKTAFEDWRYYGSNGNIDYSLKKGLIFSEILEEELARVSPSSTS